MAHGEYVYAERVFPCLFASDFQLRRIQRLVFKCSSRVILLVQCSPRPTCSCLGGERLPLMPGPCINHCDVP